MAEKQYPAKLDFSPRLRSLKSARSTFARIMRTYAAGDLDSDAARVWCYLFQTMLGIMKAEIDYSVIDRLTEIEKRLTEIEGERNESHQQRRFKAIK